MSAVLSPAARKLLEDLCSSTDGQPWHIRCEDLGGWDGSDIYLCKRKAVDRAAMAELREAGFLEGFPNGAGSGVTDLGRSAHIQSTDEMGDGQVHVPECHAIGRES